MSAPYHTWSDVEKPMTQQELLNLYTTALKTALRQASEADRSDTRKLNAEAAAALLAHADDMWKIWHNLPAKAE